MKHVKIFIFFFHALLLVNCNNCYDSARAKYINKTFYNNSCSSDFVVFTAVDTKTNTAKEICCESNALYSAYMSEVISLNKSVSQIKADEIAKKSFDSIVNNKSCNFVFHFNKAQSLMMIGFYEFNTDSVKFYSNKNTKRIIKAIKANYKPENLLFLKDFARQENIYQIFLLNKNGIYCGRDCFSGIVMIKKVID
ncbi:MAG TPA: hypothetical protein PK252_03695 [Bacteroidales bacterium]|nr:hypothetical protein [Bacteroidales bacterium]